MISKKITKICAGISFISGIIILLSVVYPIALYEAKSKREYPNLVSPLSKTSRIMENSYNLFEESDYTKASNWFPTKDEFSEAGIVSYRITIPRLGIEDALVSIGGEDLADSLIQYPGTSVPGEKGNSVIFGHSILPIFYEPDNYLAIFSTLDKLVDGDDIYVYYDEIIYRYQVVDKFEVRPIQVEVLRQDEDSSYLSLITCTPPGHPSKPKRLVVRAKIIPVTASKQ
ncbi:class E sortase [Candidatus Woesebacteria bacterium]|nr:class E sortase [Candidatus Woesebacteria bacterium]